MSSETWFLILVCGLPGYFVAIRLLNLRRDRLRRRRHIEARGGRVHHIKASGDREILIPRHRRYRVDYEDAEGMPHRRAAVTALRMGVAWRDPPPAPPTSVTPPRGGVNLPDEVAATHQRRQRWALSSAVRAGDS